MAETTPMMSQYLAIKEQHRDAVLFFRLGDFYEMFNEDAIEISRLLNLTLTQRGGNPMCGIPYHASKVYLGRLLRAGKKIAICEQLSLPGAGKGIAERKVVEVITPGTVTEDDFLETGQHNYLASISASGFAYADISTGEFAATSFDARDYESALRKEIGRVQPREILVQMSLFADYPELSRILEDYPSMVVNRYPDWNYNRDASYRRLCSAFGTSSLQAFSLTLESSELPCAAVLLDYLSQTSGSYFSHIKGIRVYRDSDYVIIDDATRKNLELTRNLRDGSSSYTLLEVLNKTRTSMGLRLLRTWIDHPLRDRERIEARLSTVDFFYRNQRLLSRIRDILSSILDIERLAGRISMDKAHGKDLLALSVSLESLVKLSRLLEAEKNTPYGFPSQIVQDASEVSSLIQKAIDPDCPTVTGEGNVIRKGWSARLDELRSNRDNSQTLLDAYLEDEKRVTGIANLKVKYNRMIGYFIEVTKGNLQSVPSHFIRRRSLTTGERFTTERLMEIETELQGIHTTILELEQGIFLEFRKSLLVFLDSCTEGARAIAEIDVLQSFAHSAAAHVWCKPEFTDDGSLELVDARHPVVEYHLPTGEFIPNSISLSSSASSALPSFALITGPNMAGKSTFLRQTALISLMAQMGSFVPAQSATMSPIDKCFCRVGATDNLARGESTFLVEMTETAHILRSATASSLIIMDEVGRGTSTGDGLSIARAVTEYLLDTIGGKTLFATHYHELSALSHKKLAGFCLQVLETGDTVVFLKKVVSGASDNSYGIHVARLAGIPEAVLEKAENYVRGIAGSLPPSAGLSSVPDVEHPISQKGSLALFSEEEMVIQDILSLDINTITPLEALKRIAQWKNSLYPDTSQAKKLF